MNKQPEARSIGALNTTTSTPSCRTIRNCLIVASGWISPSAYSRFRCSLMAELIEQALKEKNHG